MAYALGQGHLEGRGCACREKRRAIGVEKEERKDRCICIGGATGCETSIRLDSISPAATPVANPAPDEWQSNRDSRFVSRFCMTVDQGPVASDIEMAHAAPIARIDDVKSLEPRQFRADFTLTARALFAYL